MPYPNRPSSWRGTTSANDNTTFHKVLRAHIQETSLLELHDPMGKEYWASVALIAGVLLLLALFFFFV